MSRIDVLIANELPLHREVLASALRTMRPDIVVRVIPHEDLERMICQLRPLVVICTAVSTTGHACSPAWIALYPEDRDVAVIHIDGVRSVIPSASIQQLLGVMDAVRSSH